MSRRGKPVGERWTDTLTGISWDAFERLIANHYVGQGYRVDHSGTGQGGRQTDGGIDLKLYRDNQYIVVQCKHWNALQVPHNAVHELIGVMHTQGATGAILITSGEFTKAAREASMRTSSIELIDGLQLRKLLGLPLEDATFSTGSDIPSWAKQAGRQHKRQPRKSQPESWIAKLVLKTVIPLATLLGGYFYYQYTMQKFGQDTQEMLRKQQASAMEHLRQPSTTASPALHAINSTPSQLNVVYAVRQIPEISSGQNAPSIHAVTSEQVDDMKEWERKNAESMKILEKTTPVLEGE